MNIHRVFALVAASLAVVLAGCETVPETRPSGSMTLGAVTTAPRGFIALCRTSFQACPAEGAPTSDAELAQSQGAADRAYWLSRVRGSGDVGVPGATSPRSDARNERAAKTASTQVERITLTAPRIALQHEPLAKTPTFSAPMFDLAGVPAKRPFFDLVNSPSGRPDVRADVAAATGASRDRAARPFSAAIVAQYGARPWTAAADAVPIIAASTEPLERERATDLGLSAAQWSQVRRINAHINAAMQMRSDRENFGTDDVWQPGEDVIAPFGDCEDYVLQKRHDLLAAGLGAAQLSIALVRTQWGEAHAVLLLNTGEGEYVLDNLSPWIVPWTETDYEWVERQVPGDAMTWVRIGSPATT